MNYVLSYLSLAVLYFFGTTSARYIEILGIAPDLVFVFAVCYSMYNFPVRSAVLCAVAGLLVDLYSESYIGVNALLYMYIGIGISNFASSLIRKNMLTTVCGVLIVSAVYHLVILLVCYVIPEKTSFWYPLARIVIPTAVYDSVVTLVISLWAKKLSTNTVRGL